MAEKSTFIMMDRNIIEWRWFKDARMYQIFSWLIVKANIKDHAFRKVIIPRGSLATSYESIADGCGTSVMTVRRVVKNLEETGEIQREVKDHYQIIKIVKYDEYQGCSKRTGKQQPSEQPHEQPSEHPNNNNQIIYNNGNNGEEWKEDSAPLKFPCGVAKRPDWLSEDQWDLVKYRTTDDIPGADRGFYDAYIEYAEETIKQGRDIK